MTVSLCPVAALWYRMTSSHRIPETCVLPNHCGTQWPIWMSGRHPTGKAWIPSDRTCRRPAVRPGLRLFTCSQFVGDLCARTIFLPETRSAGQVCDDVSDEKIVGNLACDLVSYKRWAEKVGDLVRDLSKACTKKMAQISNHAHRNMADDEDDVIIACSATFMICAASLTLTAGK